MCARLIDQFDTASLGRHQGSVHRSHRDEPRLAATPRCDPGSRRTWSWAAGPAPDAGAVEAHQHYPGNLGRVVCGEGQNVQAPE